MIWFKTLLNLLSDILKLSDHKNYDWLCLNCSLLFDGNKPEFFIKHQIDEKHYDYTKKLKEKLS